MSVIAPSLRFGVFTLGEMQLALPIEALKEVTPMGTLSALPSEAGCVIGAISLRGIMVPVVDLRLIIHCKEPLSPNSDVVVMEHEGRLLGLAADGVVGVYVLARDAVNLVGPLDPLSSVLQAGFQRPDDDSLVSVLSPAAIAGIPKVPFVSAVQNVPFATSLAIDSGKNLTGLIDASRHLMLMRCGDIPLAIASQAVHTTLIEPKMLSSCISAGGFKGMMCFGEQEIPALELSGLCGFAPMKGGVKPQAFLMQFSAGLVAFLVDEIVNVVTADGSQIAPVPLFASMQGEMFSGTLPSEAIADEGIQSSLSRVGFHLILDEVHMFANAHLQSVAGMTRQTVHSDGGLTSVARTAQARGFRKSGQMVSYNVGVDVASPIQQIAEILPWDTASSVQGLRGSSLVMSRGRPIPVYCLSALLGNSKGANAAQSTAKVLVVEAEGQLIGFKVPHLVTIGEGQLAPRESSDLLPDVVLMGHGDGERVLRLVDLREVSAGLKAPGLADSA